MKGQELLKERIRAEGKVLPGVAALADKSFDWSEAERLAALPDFRVSERLAALKAELSTAKEETSHA